MKIFLYILAMLLLLPLAVLCLWQPEQLGSWLDMDLEQQNTCLMVRFLGVALGTLFLENTLAADSPSTWKRVLFLDSVMLGAAIIVLVMSYLYFGGLPMGFLVGGIVIAVGLLTLLGLGLYTFVF